MFYVTLLIYRINTFSPSLRTLFLSSLFIRSIFFKRMPYCCATLWSVSPSFASWYSSLPVQHSIFRSIYTTSPALSTASRPKSLCLRSDDADILNFLKNALA